MCLHRQQAPPKAILVVSTHPQLREVLVQAIRDETSYCVLTAASSLEALEATRAFVPDLLILDYYLAPLSGIALADRLHTSPHLRQLPMVLLSDQRPQEEAEIMGRGLLSLGRPFEIERLLALLERAFHYQCCGTGHHA